MQAAKKRLLIVEDEPDLREIYSMILVRQGFVVEQGNSGTEGIELLQANEYDAVVTDIMMARGNGIEVVYEAKKKNIPVIVVTAYADSEEVKIPEGTDILKKPCELNDLVTAVSQKFPVVA